MPPDLSATNLSPTAGPKGHPSWGRLPIFLDLIRWNRPAGWLLLLWPSLSALWLAADGFPGWHLLLVFILGTILMRSAGCCINDVADRHLDRHVQRTAQRPVTSGALPVADALQLGALLALFAFALVLTTNLATIVWSFAALFIAVAYPYAKRYLAMPQAVLGLAFSMGIPMAFTAVHGGPTLFAAWSAGMGLQVAGAPGLQQSLAAAWTAVPALAWWLMLGNFFWVLAYDTEYAMVDRDDDRRIGIRTSAITLGRLDLSAIVIFYLFYLSISAFAQQTRRHVATILIVTMLLALCQVAWHWTLIRHRTREGCFKAFRVNHWLGATVFAGIVLGHLL